MGTRTPSYYTGTMTGQVGSLITALDAILITGEGWTSPFAGTNEKQYQQAGGNGFRLYVNDNGTGAGAAREAIVRGCESSTALAALTDPFPTAALVADAACVWRKSDTADATTRNYWAVADDSFFCLVVQHGTNSFDCYIFGDIETYWTGDNYATAINTRAAANNLNPGLAMSGVSSNLSSAVASNFWFARTANGLTKVDRGAIIAVTTTFGNTGGTSSQYPHPQTGKLHQKITEIRSNGTTATDPSTNASLMRRGTIPFLMEFMHGVTVTGIAPLDTYTDSAYDAASQFIIFQESSSTSLAVASDRYVLQTAGTWNPGY